MINLSDLRPEILAQLRTLYLLLIPDADTDDLDFREWCDVVMRHSSPPRLDVWRRICDSVQPATEDHTRSDSEFREAVGRALSAKFAGTADLDGQEIAASVALRIIVRWAARRGWAMASAALSPAAIAGELRCFAKEEKTP